MLTIFEFICLVSVCWPIVFSVGAVVSFSDVLGFDWNQSRGPNKQGRGYVMSTGQHFDPFLVCPSVTRPVSLLADNSQLIRSQLIQNQSDVGRVKLICYTSSVVRSHLLRSLFLSLSLSPFLFSIPFCVSCLFLSSAFVPLCVRTRRFVDSIGRNKVCTISGTRLLTYGGSLLD